MGQSPLAFGFGFLPPVGIGHGALHALGDNATASPSLRPGSLAYGSPEKARGLHSEITRSSSSSSSSSSMQFSRRSCRSRRVFADFSYKENKTLQHFTLRSEKQTMNR